MAEIILPVIRLGMLVCTECESSLMVSWEDGVKYVVCPLPGCNSTQAVPKIPLTYGKDNTRSYPDGLCRCLKAFEDHVDGRCPR